MKNKSVRALTECAVFIALAIGLSYLKIPIGMTFGGLMMLVRRRNGEEQDT